ncbi:MAG: ABC transporter ATP-binding protein [Bacteroidota bacterium]
MLEAIQLTKRYQDNTALDALSLKVEAGEVYCLLGANGAGKTTTIHLFMNFIKPTDGQALVNGLDVVQQNRKVKQHIAYIPENLQLYPNLSSLENLRFFTGLSQQLPSNTDLEALLVSVGLQQAAIHRRVAKYSKGMRQKVGIAIAKAKQADNLLLDEPTSGLDPQASNDFARLIGNMRDQGMAILMATHDLFRAKAAGTHIGIMRAGRLVHSFKSEDLSLTDLEQLYLETMQTATQM